MTTYLFCEGRGASQISLALELVAISSARRRIRRQESAWRRPKKRARSRSVGGEFQNWPTWRPWFGSPVPLTRSLSSDPLKRSPRHELSGSRRCSLEGYFIGQQASPSLPCDSAGRKGHGNGISVPDQIPSNRMEPIRTIVAPAAIATSKSPLIPIDNSRIRIRSLSTFR